jgi:hypothetical protein
VSYGGRPSLLRRLSRDEIVSTLTAVVGSAPARADLPEEPRRTEGMLQTAGLSFIAPEVGRLREVMSSFSGKVAGAALAKSGCGLTGQAQRDCLLAWAIGLGDQVLRRPLRPGETDALKAMLAGAGSSPGEDAASVQAALTALFTAPSFLYRAEIGAPIPGRAEIRVLTSREVATRLSFLATLRPPDIELLSAARSGRLTDAAERVRHLDRLLRSPAGKRALAILVLEWLGANESKVAEKSARYLTPLGTDYEGAIRTSAESTIQKIVDASADPGVKELLTTDSYLRDAAVTKITQDAGSGRLATGDTAQTGRLGLLMHPYFLAAHTKEDAVSPFPLGLFVREGVLCQAVPLPPPDAAASAREDVPAGLTLREELEYRTSAGPVCTACHQQFSPLGYSFLPFDPVGRWTKKDPSGKDWDLAGSVPSFAGRDLAFSSPSDLSQTLSSHPQVRGCFAEAALTWAFGRRPVPEDGPLVATLEQVVRKTESGVGSILRAIVASPGFLNATGAR